MEMLPLHVENKGFDLQQYNNNLWNFKQSILLLKQKDWMLLRLLAEYPFYYNEVRNSVPIIWNKGKV